MQKLALQKHIQHNLQFTGCLYLHAEDIQNQDMTSIQNVFHTSITAGKATGLAFHTY